MEKSLNIVQFNLLFLSHLASYLLMPGGSSFTTTLLLHAMRSLSVAIWLRGALWCICRTPSIWPLLRRPTFGGDAISKAGLRRAEGVKKIFLHFYDQSIKPKIWSLKIAKRLYGTLIRCQVALSFASDEVFYILATDYCRCICFSNITVACNTLELSVASREYNYKKNCKDI